MSATSVLESNEDLENIPLVRMADVQPDRSSDIYLDNVNEIKRCPIDDDNFVCDDDLNIASTISIKSEDDDDGDNVEFIVPEIIKPKQEPLTIVVERAEINRNTDSWPTLEILPGGVIKHAEKYEDDLSSFYHSEDVDNDAEDNSDNNDEKMYACAKCQERFTFLFSLVKHVKRHEDQKKKAKPVETKIDIQKKKYICVHSKRRVISKLKTKCKMPLGPRHVRKVNWDNPQW